MLKETTVYVPSNEESLLFVGEYVCSYDHNEIEDCVIKKEGYFHTKEELITLLGSLWDESCTATEEENGIEYATNRIASNETIKRREQFINSLFNTEEDGK